MVKACFAVIFWLFIAISSFAQSQNKEPAWAQLSPEQQQILAPVAAEWNTFPDIQRKKLIGIAKRYPQMSPEEQKRVQSRLYEWSKLTPEQRTLARKNFQNLKQLPPEKRQEVKKKWNEYHQFQADRVEKRGSAPASAPTQATPTSPASPAVPAAAGASNTPAETSSNATTPTKQ